MMDQEQPFNPQDIEEQVDQLYSSTQKTYGTSHVEQRFLSDLRMVLSVEESENQEQEDIRSFQHVWARLEASGLSQDTIQREHSRSINRRVIAMATCHQRQKTVRSRDAES